MAAIDIFVNGESTAIQSAKNLAAVLAELEQDKGTFAIALNEQFIPRNDYEQTPIHHGDRIELLVPMQGG